MGYNFQRNHMSTRTPVDPYNLAGGGTKQMVTALTTTGGSAAMQLPAGVKSWQARVVGTGAVSATVEIQFSNDGTNWMSHADYTLTLSGTTSDVDAFTEEDAYAYHRASVTAISGTGAAVTVTVGA